MLACTLSHHGPQSKKENSLFFLHSMELLVSIGTLLISFVSCSAVTDLWQRGVHCTKYFYEAQFQLQVLVWLWNLEALSCRCPEVTNQSGMSCS